MAAVIVWRLCKDEDRTIRCICGTCSCRLVHHMPRLRRPGVDVLKDIPKHECTHCMPAWG
jgi:hypothetical protein